MYSYTNLIFSKAFVIKGRATGVEVGPALFSSFCAFFLRSPAWGAEDFLLLRALRGACEHHGLEFLVNYVPSAAFRKGGGTIAVLLNGVHPRTLLDCARSEGFVVGVVGRNSEHESTDVRVMGQGRQAAGHTSRRPWRRWT